jgi:hypothetical protein
MSSSDSTSHIVIAMAVGVIGALILCHVMGNQSDQVEPAPLAPKIRIDPAPMISKPPVQDQDAREGQYRRVTKGTRALYKSDHIKNPFPSNGLLAVTGEKYGQKVHVDSNLPLLKAPSTAPEYSS